MDIISIVCPTYNEEKHILKSMETFLNQKLNNISLEILIVDGMSTDRTRQIVSQYILTHPNLKLLDNPDRKTPYAFNIGLKNATGNYIAILGAHSYYDEDYLQTCYDELIRTNSVGCSGKVRLNIEADTTESKLVKWLQESTFGVSSGSFKTLQEGYTTIINFPVYKKEVILEIGGYDTSLHRNQDNDLNQRLFEKGYQLYHTVKTGSDYTPPDTLKKLFRYAYKNGFWNAKSMVRKPKSMKLHHIIPFIFVCSLILSFSLGTIGYLFHFVFLIYFLLLGSVILFLHITTGIIFSLKIGVKEKNVFALLLPLFFVMFHFCYGWGTINGFLHKTD